MYKCDLCNYSTNERGNFSRHKKQLKHIENLNKINEVEQLKQKIKDMEIEYNHKIELIKKEKENEKLEAINRIYKEQSFTNKTINNTQNNTINIGSINYVNEHFKDAPPLEKITNFIINGIDTNDSSQHDKFINDIIYYNNNKMLHQLLGDHIVSLYKKTDMTKQSFHTTDTSRLNYVVRIFENSQELNDDEENISSDSEDDRYNYINEDTMDMNEREFFRLKKEYDAQLEIINKTKEIKKLQLANDKKIWTTDKNGYKICKLLIDPTIKQLVSILKKRLKNKIKSKARIKNIEEELKYHNSITNIIESIDKKKLKNDINKYIAPNFNLDKKI
jgi:hypothetical protein